MEEMVEPDRTILIVSIIGLVIIWGSFFYHKFVQGGSQTPTDPATDGEGPGPTETAEAAPLISETAATPEQPHKHRRGKRRR
ncbi:MAG: hypothetical protein WDA75_08250 [Candidatus Latescibacterota bacterium]|jgi:hypothetical protein